MKRITGELSKMQKNTEGWFSVQTSEGNIKLWNITVNGPENSPFEGGKFKLKIVLPDEYPQKPPVLTVETKVYSPIVNPDDHTICAPILQTDNKPENWAPTKTIYDVILTFRTMLGDLKTEHVSDPTVAQVLSENPEKFKKTAKEWTKLYAV
ncbi:ubiquitin-conjugating enzyme E2, putative [Entamoeba invadens IP1]|uniref:Ubiquitin-conjugating enzyme E2, putative n=1 Tax=Entamoeba invadens IP1 TaxID=370355 RepID=A0A0A1UDW6_ENTIV|nr:ubiquitin-conjugating enzyme E2, putative [Entamoeba invadens IP1]ELP94785.1 ubiquitin-conjugating enzyme E2, putative [Entamoeba invadens IP1]|eukprot:XP_004261556.1 ubiquitin-conjugating enzyme E2, putative [Entamoeba invadens IP1]